MQTKHYRTIWISDVHLGTKGCQADKLHYFLKCTESDTLYLVGDIIDFWAMKRGSKWTKAHNSIVQKILKKSRHGTKVIFIPGNHDEALREYCGLQFGGIELHQEFTHTTADGKTILCIHGDYFDMVTKYHKWIAVLGDVGYSFLISVNGYLNWIRDITGMGHWSLSGYIKKKVKQAVNFVSSFEDNVVKHAKHLNVDMVLCGHIHSATITEHHGIMYLNTGDWVESLTAIVEHDDGKLELIKWNEYEQKITGSN
jgi:UDP-2,3-diacylglucosamine pyrophosphatase LpxH